MIEKRTHKLTMIIQIQIENEIQYTRLEKKKKGDELLKNQTQNKKTSNPLIKKHTHYFLL